MSRRSATVLKSCLVISAVVSALIVCGPALYWKLKKDKKLPGPYSSCPPCACDCPRPLSLLKIVPGLFNLSDTDCGSSDLELKQEIKKQVVDLLTEELKLQEDVSREHVHHMEISFAEAKRVASQYQRESEKCVAATVTCEAAREHAEALLRKEMKVTSSWEMQAHYLGWEGE